MDIDTLPPMGDSGDIDELLKSFKWPSFENNTNDESPIEHYTFPESVDPQSQVSSDPFSEQHKEIVVAQPQPTSPNVLDQFFNIEAFNNF